MIGPALLSMRALDTTIGIVYSIDAHLFFYRVKGIEWILKRVKASNTPSVVNMSHGQPKRNRFWNEQVTKVRYYILMINLRPEKY